MKDQLPLFVPAPAQLPGQVDMLDLLIPAPEQPPQDAPQPRTRPAPTPGTPVRLPGRALGPCTFYREHHGARDSWLVIDQRNRQYHAAYPEDVRIPRTRRHAP